MFILNGFLLGLSTGVFCLSLCAPVFIPLILVEKRDKKEIFWVFGKFTAGRLIAYLIFGAIAGYWGEKLNNKYLEGYISLAIIFLALLILFYSFGLLKKKGRLCALLKQIKLPFLFGFLTGINICPPFLLALSYSFKMADIGKSVLFFLMFFLATSLYIFPFTFLGFLGEFQNIRKIARVAGVVVGVVFLIQGIRDLSPYLFK